MKTLVLKTLKKIEILSAKAQDKIEQRDYKNLISLYEKRNVKIKKIMSILNRYDFEKHISFSIGCALFEIKHTESLIDKTNVLSIKKNGFFCYIDSKEGCLSDSDMSLIDEINIDVLKRVLEHQYHLLQKKKSEEEKTRLERNRAMEIAHIENQSKLLKLLEPIQEAACKADFIKEGCISFKLPNKKGTLKDVNLVYSINNGLYHVYTVFDTNCIELSTISKDGIVEVKSIRDKEVWTIVRKMSLIEDDIINKLKESLAC